MISESEEPNLGENSSSETSEQNCERNHFRTRLYESDRRSAGNARNNMQPVPHERNSPPTHATARRQLQPAACTDGRARLTVSMCLCNT